MCGFQFQALGKLERNLISPKWKASHLDSSLSFISWSSFVALQGSPEPPHRLSEARSLLGEEVVSTDNGVCFSKMDGKLRNESGQSDCILTPSRYI